MLEKSQRTLTQEDYVTKHPGPQTKKGTRRTMGTRNDARKNTKRRTIGIRWWSPTQLLTNRCETLVWQIGRDTLFCTLCGSTWYG